ncbi:hypothetical protein LJC71_10965 [Desulfosarcina sp. OttesenSCG-928-A07]|nr:hypothetical protein [Desulfosarcina sp. OttesenSCG-928-A07]
MKQLSSTQNAIKSLRDKAARFDSGFRRQYPLLVQYIDGIAPIEHCSTQFYREKIQSHLQLIHQIHSEADRLEAMSGNHRPAAVHFPPG